MKNLLAVMVLASSPALATMQMKRIAYQADKTHLEGVLVYDDGGAPPRPALVMVPNWMGITEANLKQAELVAGRGYVVFVADMYGPAARPKTGDQARQVSGALKGDRPLMRKRILAALGALQAQSSAKVFPGHVGAIGFCFGGTAALELARAGAPLAAVVTFHAGLSSPTPQDARHITARVLALTGADDPFVPPDEVAAFEAEMRAAKLDWQLVSFGNAVHGFTDPDANTPGKVQYNPAVANRAYRMMDDFFSEAFRAASPSSP